MEINLCLIPILVYNETVMGINLCLIPILGIQRNGDRNKSLLNSHIGYTMEH